MPPNRGGFFMVRSYYPAECHADYFDCHKAASDVRDEFVSVTAKLMDELAQCYNLLPQLDINTTIDHRPEGDEKWFLENEKTVTQFCRKLAAERPLKDIRDEYNYPKKKG